MKRHALITSLLLTACAADVPEESEVGSEVNVDETKGQSVVSAPPGMAGTDAQASAARTPQPEPSLSTYCGMPPERCHPNDPSSGNDCTLVCALYGHYEGGYCQEYTAADYNYCYTQYINNVETFDCNGTDPVFSKLCISGSPP